MLRPQTFSSLPLANHGGVWLADEAEALLGCLDFAQLFRHTGQLQLEVLLHALQLLLEALHRLGAGPQRLLRLSLHLLRCVILLDW